MKNLISTGGTLVLALILIAAPSWVSADPPKESSSMKMDMDHGKMMGHPEYGMDREKGHGEDRRDDRGGMKLFSKNWKHTLSDEQKQKADRMHVELMKASAPLHAQMETKEAELTGLVAQDKPEMQAIQKKIDEILGLKRELTLKYTDHKIQVRAMLTPEQRLSFDMDLLNKKGPHGN